MVDLSPWMAFTVEFKIGSRAVSPYLLSPLLRYQEARGDGISSWACAALARYKSVSS